MMKPTRGKKFRKPSSRKSQVGTKTNAFPFKSTYTKPNSIVNRFMIISQLELEISTLPYTIKNMPELKRADLIFKDKNMSFIVPQGYDIDDISDHFVESVRIKAKRNDVKLNLDEWWNRNKFYYTDPKKARESLYQKYHEVTTFRPSVMGSVIRYFNAKSVLDFSAGWGDRLIGSMAKNIDRYTGVDPNSEIPYGTIETFFRKNFRIDTRVKMINKPFEMVSDHELGEEKFDITFTSPPYFDLEIYTSEPTQSIHGRDLDAWLEEFMFVSLRKAVRHTSNYIILVIEDMRSGVKYVDRIKDELATWDTVRYEGVISYAKKNKNGSLTQAHPMWVWKVL